MSKKYEKILIYSLLLLSGLVGSQFFEGRYQPWIQLVTMFSLSYIMIHVGYEFEIDKTKVRDYLWDYGVAATAATLPWIFCAMYFIYYLDMNSWTEALMLARFSSPTSAGVLFSMLILAGLSSTWVFRKARVLAIFDDLDTILLMIPLKIMMVGMKWQLLIIIAVIFGLLGLAWRYLHSLKVSSHWFWMIVYSLLITLVSEFIYLKSKLIDPLVPIHIEVLLPAFVLGCMLTRPQDHFINKEEKTEISPGVKEYSTESTVTALVTAIFMIFTGLSMPKISIEELNWMIVFKHVVLITLLSNLGKMFPIFCYRKEAKLKELALSIAMFPRGEVGASVLVMSIGYGVGGQALTVAALPLALNLLFTGVFIGFVKQLIPQTNDHSLKLSSSENSK
jgi:Kef-type K+ transport system membrane component KefB